MLVDKDGQPVPFAVYDRRLSDDEVRAVESYFTEAYQQPIVVQQ